MYVSRHHHMYKLEKDQGLSTLFQDNAMGSSMPWFPDSFKNDVLLCLQQNALFTTECFSGNRGTEGYFYSGLSTSSGDEPRTKVLLFQHRRTNIKINTHTC